MFARPDGSLDRMGSEGMAYGGHHFVQCDPDWFTVDGPHGFVHEMEEALWELTVPARFALSLMHCRNVTLRLSIRPSP
jgi:hypothetical protein